jgi:Helix-turn-helix domain
VSKARLVITAVVVEGRSPAEVAAGYGVSRSWVYELMARYRAEGDTAFEPRSRRPKTSPLALPASTVELIVELRKDLEGQGLDAGPDTIVWHRPAARALVAGAHAVDLQPCATPTTVGRCRCLRPAGG